MHPALANWQVFSSARGVGIDDFARASRGDPSSLLLEIDPPLHDRTRGVMNRFCRRSARCADARQFRRQGRRLADELVARRRFDAIHDLAGSPYPLQVFPDAVGAARPDRRENLLPWRRHGVQLVRAAQRIVRAIDLPRLRPVLDWIFAQCKRRALARGASAHRSPPSTPADRARRGRSAGVRALLTAGLDTTVIRLGTTIHASPRTPTNTGGAVADPALLKPSFDGTHPLNRRSSARRRARRRSRAWFDEGSKVLLFPRRHNHDLAPVGTGRRPSRSDAKTPAMWRSATASHVVGQMVARLEAE